MSGGAWLHPDQSCVCTEIGETCDATEPPLSPTLRSYRGIMPVRSVQENSSEGKDADRTKIEILRRRSDCGLRPQKQSDRKRYSPPPDKVPDSTRARDSHVGMASLGIDSQPFPISPGGRETRQDGEEWRALSPSYPNDMPRGFA